MSYNHTIIEMLGGVSVNDFKDPLAKLGIVLNKTILEKCNSQRFHSLFAILSLMLLFVFTHLPFCFIVGAGLCDIHGFNASSLANLIDAFLSNDGASDLTLENFGKFEASVVKNAKVCYEGRMMCHDSLYIRVHTSSLLHLYFI